VIQSGGNGSESVHPVDRAKAVTNLGSLPICENPAAVLVLSAT
jgi:hypothetical protein